MAAPALTRLATGGHSHRPTGRFQQARHHMESVLLVRLSSKLVVRPIMMQSAKARRQHKTRPQHKLAWAIVAMHSASYNRMPRIPDFAPRVRFSRKTLTLASTALLLPLVSLQTTYLRWKAFWVLLEQAIQASSSAIRQIRLPRHRLPRPK